MNRPAANPKPQREENVGRASLYAYYAGFSPSFALGTLRALSIRGAATVLDPWNGSGTTSQVALEEGLSPVGYDINPAMVVIAKARLLESDVKESLRVLGSHILQRARSHRDGQLTRADALCGWFSPASAASLRAIESAICYYLVDASSACQAPVDPGRISALASFYYVALFELTRRLLSPYQSSNPTWLRLPGHPSARLRTGHRTIELLFRNSVRRMAAAIGERRSENATPSGRAILAVADSRCLPLGDRSIDVVLTSPPYCTRLDYAVATRPELAVMGYDGCSFRRLRESMLGTAAISTPVPTRLENWGKTCESFLDKIETHPSKASSTYYLRTHLQYFDGLFTSLKEIARVLKPGAPCILVVQDSHYKDVHNDLPRIATEMAGSLGMALRSRSDFPVATLLAASQPHTRQYRKKITAVESVLHLTAA